MGWRASFILFLLSAISYGLCEDPTQNTELSIQFSENLLQNRLRLPEIDNDILNASILMRYAQTDLNNLLKAYYKAKASAFQISSDRLNYQTRLFEYQTALANQQGVQADILLWKIRVENSCKPGGLEKKNIRALAKAMKIKWHALVENRKAEFELINQQIDFAKHELEYHQKRFEIGGETPLRIRNLKFEIERLDRLLQVRKHQLKTVQDFLTDLEKVTLAS